MVCKVTKGANECGGGKNLLEILLWAFIDDTSCSYFP